MSAEDFVEITDKKLDLEKLIDITRSPEAGAITTFIGTTRNVHNGKEVTLLSYEAYVPMAIKELKKLCENVRSRWKITKIAIAHRIGEVPIKEESVIIVVSSVHRKESIEATHWAIDELKAKVPIWKREFYADGSSSWKENSECCFNPNHQSGHQHNNNNNNDNNSNSNNSHQHSHSSHQ